MKVTVEHLPSRQVVLNIEAEAEEMDKSKKQAYQHLVQRARVPGFRQGKAPMAMLERYAGKAVFLEEAIQHLVPEMTAKAVEEQGIEAAGEPQIEIVETEPVTWKATVDLTPEVDLKGYKNIRLPLPPVKVGKEEIDNALEELQSSQAPWEPAERKAQVGDLLTVDIHADEGGRQVADDKGVQYRLMEGSPSPVPGFAEQLVGMGGGEGKEFTISSPQVGEEGESQGAEYNFKVQVSEVKIKSLPVLDDEFAKGVGEGFDTLKALRDDVRSQIRGSKDREAKSELQEKALKAVVEGATVVYSPNIAHHEAEHMVQEQEDRLSRNRMSMDDYLQGVGKSREELVEEMMASAKERVVRSIVVTELKERENIDVTDEELEEELKSLPGGGQEGEALRRFFDSPEGRQSIRRSLLTRKTLERLVEIVSQPAKKPAVKATKTAKAKEDKATNDEPA